MFGFAFIYPRPAAGAIAGVAPKRWVAPKPPPGCKSAIAGVAEDWPRRPEVLERLSEDARESCQHRNSHCWRSSKQEIPVLGVVNTGNTGNAIAGMAQVEISYMSKFGGPPGINFGAKSITSQIPKFSISVLF